MIRFASGRSVLRCSAWVFAVVTLAGCPDEVHHFVGFDAGDAMVPRDAGRDSSTDATVPTDSGPIDASGVVTCNAGSPIEMFRTAYLVGNQVPYGAAANVNGLMVGATVITDVGYPEQSRVAGFISQTGSVTSPSPLSAATTVMSTSVAFTQNQNGFLAVFDEAPSAGMPTELWTRLADMSGVLMGTMPTQLTSTASNAETFVRVVRTSTGFVATWRDDVTGPRVAVLDTAAALVGSSQSATAVAGMATTLEPFVIGTSAFAAYFGSDQKVHTTAIAANGSVGAAATVSALAGTGNFGIAGGPSVGGVAYEVAASGGRSNLQFRTVNSDGSANLAETTLNGPGESGERPSVAPLAGGFLVLFRFVPATGTAKLRLAFVSGNGVLLSTRDLVDAFPAAPRFSLHVSPDNDVYVVYHESVMLTVAGGAMVPGAAVMALEVACQ